jgi:hypothetical protein
MAGTAAPRRTPEKPTSRLVGQASSMRHRFVTKASPVCLPWVASTILGSLGLLDELRGRTR